MVVDGESALFVDDGWWKDPEHLEILYKNNVANTMLPTFQAHHATISWVGIRMVGCDSDVSIMLCFWLDSDDCAGGTSMASCALAGCVVSVLHNIGLNGWCLRVCKVTRCHLAGGFCDWWLCTGRKTVVRSGVWYGGILSNLDNGLLFVGQVDGRLWQSLVREKPTLLFWNCG